jgi:hypothetical protein
MAETYDVKTAIPSEVFKQVSSTLFSGLTDPNKIVVGDPYIKFPWAGEEFYTRNFNHSELVPEKTIITDYFDPKKSKGYSLTSGKSFQIPLMETGPAGTGKLIGYVTGHINTDRKTGNNVFNVSSMQIKHGTSYGETFASGKKDMGLKTNIARNILTQILLKLPFIDEMEGHRVSGARKLAREAERTKISQRSFINRVGMGIYSHLMGTEYTPKTIEGTAKLTPNVITRIKNVLTGQGLMEGFFSQSKLSTENVKEWLTKNKRAVAGVAMSGNDPMQSLGIKSMGSAIDDPANFYLKMKEGGAVEEDDFYNDFSDMIEFVPSTRMNRDGKIRNPVYKKEMYNSIEKAIR